MRLHAFEQRLTVKEIRNDRRAKERESRSPRESNMSGSFNSHTARRTIGLIVEHSYDRNIEEDEETISIISNVCKRRLKREKSAPEKSIRYACLSAFDLVVPQGSHLSLR